MTNSFPDPPLHPPTHLTMEERRARLRRWAKDAAKDPAVEEALQKILAERPHLRTRKPTVGD